MAELRAEDAWRTQSGEAWVRLNARTDVQLQPYGQAVLAALDIRPGEAVLDVGCGCGQTLLELAERVGPNGHVTGLDISEPMLALARERAAGHPQIEILLGDAATHALPAARFDALFSRFGVMFFQDSVAAFATLRRALKPNGRLGFVCWQAPSLNPWVSLPLAAARGALPGAGWPPLFDPELPGPFYFSEPARVESILTGAGWSRVELRSLNVQSLLGGSRTLAEAVDYVYQSGPTARLLAEADPEHKPEVRRALEQALAPWVTADGVLCDGAAFVVTAQNG
jgi:SAM-dependent methyltransferase